MNLEADLYSPRSIPLQSAQTFLETKLRQLGWTKFGDEEVIMDVGCGPGGTTKRLILPLFRKCTKIFAIDALPNMIKLAKTQNYSSQIEYSVANIEEWSSLQCWENQITKLVSIHCLHWLKEQRRAFQNIYKLLQKGGEAALLFVLQSTYHSTILEMQNRSKWSQLLKSVENFVPDSQYKGYDDSYYKKILEEEGFDVLYCKGEERIDIFPSEAEFREFFTSLCVLRQYVPPEQLADFEVDFIEALLQKNGRDIHGNPFHKGNFVEILIRKKMTNENCTLRIFNLFILWRQFVFNTCTQSIMNENHV